MWFKNVFVTADPDRVNARLHAASQRNLEIARDVLGRVPADATREALRQAIVTIIRQEISLGRMRHSTGAKARWSITGVPGG